MPGFDLGAALAARGYVVDTAFTLKMAVADFQKEAGLAVDGVAGPRTIAALRAAPAPKAPARPAPSPSPVPAAPMASPTADGIAGLLTLDRLHRFEPRGNPAILAGVAASVPAIEAAGIVSAKRLCHFLAHVSVESQGFSRCEESLSYSAERLCEVWPGRFPTPASARPYAHNPRALAIKVYGGRMGNAPAPSADGWDFRGSGGLGTTGRDNFVELGAAGDPDRLRTPEGFLTPALHYWASRRCNALADRDDVDGLTRAINGGLNGLDDRKARLAVARRVFAA